MPYIIDGHNLIAAMPDIQLDDLDDERKLLDRLQPLSQREARKIYVYFDQGQTAGRNDFMVGRIHVRFVTPPRTADEAIGAHLTTIGSEGPNWLVISSDHEVQQQAARVGAKTLSSGEFVESFILQSDEPAVESKPEPSLSSDEIDAWEKLFRSRGDKT